MGRKKQRGGQNIFVYILVFSHMIRLFCLHWKGPSKFRGWVVFIRSYFDFHVFLYGAMILYLNLTGVEVHDHRLQRMERSM